MYGSKKACELTVSFFEKGLRNCFYFSFQIITLVVFILGIGLRWTLKIKLNFTFSIEAQKTKPFIVVLGGITILCVFFLRNPCDKNPCSSNLHICKKISGWKHKCEYRDQCDVINCGQGKCINGTCACNDGYVENVKLKVCEETCLLSPCQEMNTYLVWIIHLMHNKLIKSYSCFISIK